MVDCVTSLKSKCLDYQKFCFKSNFLEDLGIANDLKSLRQTMRQLYSTRISPQTLTKDINIPTPKTSPYRI